MMYVTVRHEMYVIIRIFTKSYDMSIKTYCDFVFFSLSIINVTVTLPYFCCDLSKRRVMSIYRRFIVLSSKIFKDKKWPGELPLLWSVNHCTCRPNVIMSEQRIERIKKSINAVPDFPKPGILFRDIFPLFKDVSVITDTISLMVEHVKEKFGSVDVIVGLDARGFLFGPMMAVQLGCSFVPIRKKGKLPGKCVQASYTLEYGDDVVEAQVGAITKGQRVVIVDDLIATGGTMRAASNLVTQMSGTILECLVLIELLDLKGSETLKYPFHSFLKY